MPGKGPGSEERIVIGVAYSTPETAPVQGFAEMDGGRRWVGKLASAGAWLQRRGFRPQIPLGSSLVAAIGLKVAHVVAAGGCAAGRAEGEWREFGREEDENW